MNFTVVNLQTMKSKKFHDTIKKPYICISVSNWQTEPYSVPANNLCPAVLYLKFDDVSYSTDDEMNYQYDDGYEPIPFTDNNAADIVRFVKKWNSHTDDILINCEAGISRSPGIAMALSQWLNKDNAIPEMYIRTMHSFGIRFHNKMVRDMISNQINNGT